MPPCTCIARQVIIVRQFSHRLSHCCDTLHCHRQNWYETQPRYITLFQDMRPMLPAVLWCTKGIYFCFSGLFPRFIYRIICLQPPDMAAVRGCRRKPYQVHSTRTPNHQHRYMHDAMRILPACAAAADSPKTIPRGLFVRVTSIQLCLDYDDLRLYLQYTLCTTTTVVLDYCLLL